MNRRIRLVLLVFLLLLLLVVDLVFGSVSIPLSELMGCLGNTNDVSSTILLKIRIPKAITAILAGAALSMSGLMMQTLFRNPLAGPYVLGISSGATLGVSVFLLLLSMLGITVAGWWLHWGLALFAMVGAFLLFLLIMGASFRVNDSVTLLIVGVLFGTVASSVVSILQHLSDPDSVKFFVNWTLGSLSQTSGDQLWVMLILITIGLVLHLMMMKEMDVLLLGEDYAASVGVTISRVRLVLILSTVLMTGVTTAFVGPIGFVGLVVPHVARGMMRTSNHRVLFPTTLLLGASMMLLSDILSQLPPNGYVLPINAVTALMGIPIVIWMILGRAKMLV